MPLTPAGRPGPYEILAPPGAGGTGEVCRATGSTLRRGVAIRPRSAGLFDVSSDGRPLVFYEREVLPAIGMIEDVRAERP